jgi:RNA polymerase sigma-70 factor (ECF subfamily)
LAERAGSGSIPTDQGLLVADDETFARRTDAYVARAFGLACYILGNSSDAEDATQEAMTRAWTARRSLREPASFDAWFDRILVNCCRERLRRQHRMREVPLPAGGEAEVTDDFAAVLARDTIGRALTSLTAEQRTVVVLRYWRDLSLEQIAARVAWPLGTVKSRLHHALAAIRASVESDDAEVQS